MKGGFKERGLLVGYSTKRGPQGTRAAESSWLWWPGQGISSSKGLNRTAGSSPYPSNVGELALAVCVLKSWWADQLSFQGSELAHSKIHPIYELLQRIKGQVLQIQSSRIFTAQGYAQGNDRIQVEEPVLIV